MRRPEKGKPIQPCPCCASQRDRTGAVLVSMGMGLPVRVEICPDCLAQFADEGARWAVYIEPDPIRVAAARAARIL